MNLCGGSYSSLEHGRRAVAISNTRFVMMCSIMFS